MITLNVNSYCHNCSEFDPDVSILRLDEFYRVRCETTISCKRRDVCRNIVDHIKKDLEESYRKSKEGESADGVGVHTGYNQIIIEKEKEN